VQITPPRTTPISTPSDPFEWRPQRARASRTGRAVTNAILEPAWDGDHVLVHVDGLGGTRIIAEDGEDVSTLDPALTALVGAAIASGSAIIDGFLTTQATRPGSTVSLVPRFRKRPLGMLLGPGVEQDLTPGPEAVPPGEETVAFVAVDLLRVDGQDLFDVPLLERKRILEGIIVPGARVRVSPFTQPPVEHWLRSWEAAGFRGVMMKAANSRYRPGAETSEWVFARARSR
jgi:bifunctional non-homologous end joining protein LigD